MGNSGTKQASQQDIDKFIALRQRVIEEQKSNKQPHNNRQQTTKPDKNGWQEVRAQRNHPSQQKQEQRGYTITSEIEARLGLKPTAHISSSVSYRDSATRTKSECEEQTLEVAQSTSSSERQMKVKNSDKQLRDFNRQQRRHPKRTDISKLIQTEKQTEVKEEP